MDGVRPRRCVVCGMAVACAAPCWSILVQWYSPCPPIPVQYSLVLLLGRVLSRCRVCDVCCVCVLFVWWGILCLLPPLVVVVGGGMVRWGGMVSEGRVLLHWPPRLRVIVPLLFVWWSR